MCVAGGGAEGGAGRAPRPRPGPPPLGVQRWLAYGNLSHHARTLAPCSRALAAGLSDPPLWPLIDLLAEMESSGSSGGAAAAAAPSRKGADSVASSGDAPPSSISV